MRIPQAHATLLASHRISIVATPLCHSSHKQLYRVPMRPIHIQKDVATTQHSTQLLRYNNVGPGNTGTLGCHTLMRQPLTRR